MATWFILSVLSTIFAGTFVFMQKIAAVRGYNSNLVNSYSAAISSIIGFGIATTVEGFTELSFIILGIAMLSGVTFIIGSNLRMDALRHIDATIFFPMHKFVSPLFALLIGIYFFKESLSLYEWMGIIIGLITPLLLITKAENLRQKQLTKGLVLTMCSACLAAISISINKHGTTVFSSVLLFASVSQMCGAFFGFLTRYLHKKTANQSVVHIKPTFTFTLLMGILQYGSFITLLLAFSHGGLLSVAYTINSLYILIPIILSIIFYKEHWNTKKVLAVILSLTAIFLLK